MTLIKIFSKVVEIVEMQRRDASQIDDYNIEASFQMGGAGSHPCVPGAGDLLPRHVNHGDHQRIS